ncbi:MAG TPA: hypothetical protein VNJ49_08985 [Bradyrhizobium sp.]|nr:hypothetical protein [Bradyrhizobium sp.]
MVDQSFEHGAAGTAKDECCLQSDCVNFPARPHEDSTRPPSSWSAAHQGLDRDPQLALRVDRGSPNRSTIFDTKPISATALTFKDAADPARRAKAMKMGTVVSPWRHEVSAGHPTRRAELPWHAVLRYDLRRTSESSRMIPPMGLRESACYRTMMSAAIEAAKRSAAGVGTGGCLAGTGWRQQQTCQ